MDSPRIDICGDVLSNQAVRHCDIVHVCNLEPYHIETNESAVHECECGVEWDQ